MSNVIFIQCFSKQDADNCVSLFFKNHQLKLEKLIFHLLAYLQEIRIGRVYLHKLGNTYNREVTSPWSVKKK